MLQPRLFAASLIACLMLAGGTARAAATPNENAVKAIRAAEQGWTDAELGGDVTYIDALLLPTYRSVDAHGIAHPKSAIIASSLRFKKMPELARTARRRLANDPPGMHIDLHGDMAVVTFYDRRLGSQKGTKSCDVFVYTGGRWRAVYSQHTSVGLQAKRAK